MPPRRLRDYLFRLADARCKVRHCSDLPCDECFCVVEHEYVARLRRRREREARKIASNAVGLERKTA